LQHTKGKQVSGNEDEEASGNEDEEASGNEDEYKDDGGNQDEDDVGGLVDEDKVSNLFRCCCIFRISHMILPTLAWRFYHPRTQNFTTQGHLIFTSKSHMILPDFLATALVLDNFLLN
jgi:hypothetical protein